MPRPVFPVLCALVVAGMLLIGCSEPKRMNGKRAPDVGPPPPPVKAHDDHDHAGHDHADHAHDEAGKAGSAEAMPAGEGDDHGHHHPETLGELVGELEKLVAVVKEGMESNVREKADAPVHEFGHFIGDVEGLAKDAKLPADVEAAVIAAAESLFQAFDKIDVAIHGSDDLAKVWGEESAGIEAGMKTLKDAVAK